MFSPGAGGPIPVNADKFPDRLPGKFHRFARWRNCRGTEATRDKYLRSCGSPDRRRIHWQGVSRTHRGRCGVIYDDVFQV